MKRGQVGEAKSRSTKKRAPESVIASSNSAFSLKPYHRFQFYATIGGFSSGENCVLAAVNNTVYGALTIFLLSVLQTGKGFCVFKISVIVHNIYCLKFSLSYTADYTGTCPKSSVIFWLIHR